MDVEGGPAMSGSLRQRSPGTWELKFESGADPATGKRKTVTRTVRGTKREAQARLVELLGEAARGTLVDRNRETLGEFLARWDRDWAAHNASGKTRWRWRQLIDNQLVPRLGRVPIQAIKPAHLIELYATLIREGGVGGGPLAPRTVGHCHRLLRRALGHALAWGLIPQNPAAVARPPRVADKEVGIPSETEIAALLGHLRDHNRLFYALAVLVLATGIRRGEACGLTWKDLDFDACMLRVERSLEMTKEEGPKIKSPKTRHGKRAISVPFSAVEALRAHWKTQQEERLALGLGRAAPDDPIFTLADGSQLKPDSLSALWLRAARAAGRSINLHSLRHHHASNLIAAGVDVLAVSRRLGHASPTITLAVYGHLYPRADDKAAQAVEAMFARVSAVTP
jgi:integrase